MTNLLKHQKVNNFFEISKRIYLCIFTVYLITREIFALNYFIDSYIITGTIFGIAILFVGIDLLTNRYFLKTRFIAIAIGFAFITTISCIINREYGIFSNIKGLAAFFIYLFLLYPEVFKDKDNRTFDACLYTGYYTMTLYSLASLPMYIYNVTYETTTRKYQGFIVSNSRLWGIFQDPNYLALYSLIAIFASIYFFIKTKSVFYKIVLVLLGIIHLMTFSLTGSNMGRVCAIAALFWLFLTIIFRKLTLNTVKRILALVMALIISIAAPIGITKAINLSLPTVKKIIIHSGNVETYMNVHKAYDAFYKFGHIEFYHGQIEEIDPGDFPFDDLNKPIERFDDDSDISNGRFDRWIDGLKLIAKKPLLGLSPRNIIEFAKNAGFETLMGENEYTIHNTYLELIAGAGIIGGIFIFLFLIFAAIQVIKRALNLNPDIKTVICTIFIIMVTISGVLLPDIFFFQLTFAGQIFWLSLGRCLNSDEDEYKNSFTYKLLAKCFERKSKS